MNKNKINNEFFKKINVLSSKNHEKAFIFCENFEKTKNFLNFNNYNYTPYRFANTICIDTDIEDIKLLSDLHSVKFINNNAKVLCLGSEKNFINIKNLT